MKSASLLPGLGTTSYSHRAVRGMDIRMDSIRPPVFKPKVVPRSYTRLNSTYLWDQQEREQQGRPADSAEEMTAVSNRCRF
jgi:hypothetical protein